MRGRIAGTAVPLASLRGVWMGGAVICAMLLALLTKNAFAAEQPRVLLLHAFGHPFSPWSDMAGSFRAELVRTLREPIDLYEVSLDTGQADNSQDEQPFVNYIRALLAGRKPDLIVPVGAPATFFIQRHLTQLFPAAPMLVVGADLRRVPTASLPNNATAVLLDLDLPAYIENILRLLPQTTQVSVVVGNSAVERFWIAELRKDFYQFKNRVKLEWFNDLTFSEMLHRASTMPPHSAILWFLLSEDAAGVPYMQDQALEAMREVASVPIFGLGDYELGRGIVGGPLMQTRSLGRAAAEVARRILKGEKPSSINPPAVLFGVPNYDARELRRWGISESLLPTNSIVQFREPSVWEQYRWAIILAGAIIVVQALSIAYVLFQGRRRRVAEAEAAAQRREMAHLMRVSVLGGLSGAIAHEINQPLTAILSNAQAALHLLAQKSPDLVEVREAIDDVVREDNRAGEVIGRLRKLLRKGERTLEAVDLNELSISTLALLKGELIARRIESETKLADALPPILGDSVQLQQILLNLLMNAMDAMASTPIAKRHLFISTRATETGSVDVLIIDNGHGIAASQQASLFRPFYTSKAQGLGLGLAICSTIAQAHGGKLTLANHQPGGAIAILSLPTHQQVVATK